MPPEQQSACQYSVKTPKKVNSDKTSHFHRHSCPNFVFFGEKQEKCRFCSEFNAVSKKIEFFTEK